MLTTFLVLIFTKSQVGSKLLVYPFKSAWQYQRKVAKIVPLPGIWLKIWNFSSQGGNLRRSSENDRTLSYPENQRRCPLLTRGIWMYRSFEYDSLLLLCLFCIPSVLGISWKVLEKLRRATYKATVCKFRGGKIILINIWFNIQFNIRFIIW